MDIVNVQKHHDRVVALRGMGWSYPKIAEHTGYSVWHVRDIVLARLAHSAALDDEARRVMNARYEEVLQRLGHQLFENGDDAEIDMWMLDRYLKTLMQQASITIPKLPTRVDVTVETESIDAIEFTQRVQRFMNMADVVVANRLGSGRSDDVIDVAAIESNGHAESNGHG